MRNEAACRYLGDAGLDSPSPFQDFLKSLGVRPPPDLPVLEAVRLGWLRPSTTVLLPPEFLLEWKRFPTLPREPVRPEINWAMHIWDLLAGGSSPNKLDIRRAPAGRWYGHCLDDPDHWITKEAAKGFLFQGAVPEVPVVKHPLNPQREIQSCVFFFPYWEAYRYAEMLQAASLCLCLLNRPGLVLEEESLRSSFEFRAEFADAKMQGVAKRWDQLSETFDWISRFRTLVGICTRRASVDSDRFSVELSEGAAQLRKDIGLSNRDLKRRIRDQLLVLWGRWSRTSGLERGDQNPLLVSLREDIQRGVSFLQLTSKRRVEIDDPYWGLPSDRRAALWTPLPEVLPYEPEVWRRQFPTRVPLYLERFNAAVSKRAVLTEGVTRKLVDRYWHGSVPLRRFVTAFGRLHEHYEGKHDGGPLIREETPIDFLVLSALACERLMTSPIQKEAERVLVRCGSRKPAKALTELQKLINDKTKLHALPSTLEDPFLKAPESLKKRGNRTVAPFLERANRTVASVLVSYVNFVILRNYAAHHDCLDEELIYTEMGRPAMEALLVVALNALRNREPSGS